MASRSISRPLNSSSPNTRTHRIRRSAATPLVESTLRAFPDFEQVLRLAAHGFQLFPIRARNKKPLPGLKWKREATSEEARLREWQRIYPDCNWAAATSSDRFVVDVDEYHGGRDSLTALAAQGHQLPPTLTTRTGSGQGRHLWLQGNGTAIRNSASKLGRGLDIRAKGGYVVVPPSITAHPYTFANEDVPVATAPEWLLQKLQQPPQPKPKPTSAAVAGGPLRTQPRFGLLRNGARNDGLMRLAGALRRKGATAADLQAKLLEANWRRCLEPLAEREVLKIARSVARYPIGGPDPLETAWRLAAEETHLSKEERFGALLRHLQEARPGLPIALPLERIGELMGCDYTQVRRWRNRAATKGTLQLVQRAVAHRRAAQYLFQEAPPPTSPPRPQWLSRTPRTQTKDLQ